MQSGASHGGIKLHQLPAASQSRYASKVPCERLYFRLQPLDLRILRREGGAGLFGVALVNAPARHISFQIVLEDVICYAALIPVSGRNAFRLFPVEPEVSMSALERGHQIGKLFRLGKLIHAFSPFAASRRSIYSWTSRLTTSSRTLSISSLCISFAVGSPISRRISIRHQI